VRDFVLGIAIRVETRTMIAAPAAADLQRELAASLLSGGASVFFVTRYLSRLSFAR